MTYVLLVQCVPLPHYDLGHNGAEMRTPSMEYCFMEEAYALLPLGRLQINQLPLRERGS